MRKNDHLRHVDPDFTVAVRRHHKIDKARLSALVAALLLIAAVMILAPRVAYVFADDGEELTESIQSILDVLDLSGVQAYLDEYGDDFVYNFGDSAREMVEFFLSGDLGLDFTEYLGKLLSALFDGVSSLIPAFAQIVAVCILCSVCTGAEGGVLGKTTAKAIRLACLALIMLILSSMLVGIVASATKCVQNIRKQVEIITPVLITLTVLTGGSASGAIYQPAAVFLGNGAIEIVSGLIFPATVGVIVLNFLSQLNPQITFSGVSSLIKSVMKTIIGITVAVFGLFITVQSSASSLFNGIFFKVTKYLVGNSVPIVGNFLSAGVDMVVMAGSLVRSSVGVLGIVLLLSEVVQPVLLLAAFSFMLKIAGAIVQPLGEKTLFGLFSELSKDVEYLIAGLLTVAFMYLLTVMLMINSANSFV